jgi:hypothetical protein
MGQLKMGHLTVEDAGEGDVKLGRAIVGATGGALLMGIVYGVVGKVVGEYSYIAFLIGAVSGLGAIKLGGGRSMVAGAVAAVMSLVGVIGGKLILGAPEGVSWVAYHTTMFDILFCYVANPAAAFFAAGTDKARGLLQKLPF